MSILRILLAVLAVSFATAAEAASCRTNRDCPQNLTCNQGQCVRSVRVNPCVACWRQGLQCSHGRCYQQHTCKISEYLCSTPWTNTCCLLEERCSADFKNKDDPCI